MAFGPEHQTRDGDVCADCGVIVGTRDADGYEIPCNPIRPIVEYTDPKLAGAHKVVWPGANGRTASGYGRKIASRFMLNYAGRWRRIYVMVFSNNGSAYVVVNGAEVFLDSDTEHRVRESI